MANCVYLIVKSCLKYISALLASPTHEQVSEQVEQNVKQEHCDDIQVEMIDLEAEMLKDFFASLKARKLR